jgi:hypothetical protein
LVKNVAGAAHIHKGVAAHLAVFELQALWITVGIEGLDLGNHVVSCQGETVFFFAWIC